MKRAARRLARAAGAAVTAALAGLEAMLAWAWLRGTLYVARYGRAENPYAAEDADIAGICALLLLPLCLGALAWAARETVLWWKTRAKARTER